VEGLLLADTATGRWLSGRERLEPRRREASGSTLVTGAWFRGRAGPDVVLPRGQLVAIAGPAGSGKSALIDALADGFLPELGRTVVADRAAGMSPRSNPATYLGTWDVLRELLAATADAQVRALSASAFSLNTVGGRCEACKGSGERTVELGPLPDVVQTCPVCGGRRFQADVLEVRWKGANAAELLELTAEAARTLLAGHPKLEQTLRALVRVGLGYVPLGQPVHTLSGGEARRLVLARELARAQRRGVEDTVYLLDDPTSGLHPADVAALVGLLRELTDEGATVWVGTHDARLIAAADSVVYVPERPMDRSGDYLGASIR
jgi:excinuclease ABC subunit A